MNCGYCGREFKDAFDKAIRFPSTGGPYYHSSCIAQRLNEGEEAIALLKKYHTTPVPSGRWEAIGHFLSKLKW